jgi:glycosyltransferase involved in cell wall biosynthesis
MTNAFRQRGNHPSAVLLRKLVPLFLYPGKDHVGQGDYAIDFEADIAVYDGMDWYSPISWIGAWSFLNSQKPEVIIIHWWTSSVAHMQILVSLFSRLTGKRPIIILEMHEVIDTLEEKILPIRLYSRVAGRLLMRLCDLYTAHSEEVRRNIIKTYRPAGHKIFVVPHGPYNYYDLIDREEARNELGLDGFVVLYFGMIRQYKGVPLLIEAFSRLPESMAEQSRLVIAGEDWHDDKEIGPSLEGSVYKERIRYIPEFISDSLVPRYFSAADVVVLPYMRSGGSGVANIAVSQGKSIILSDVPALREGFEGYPGASFFPVGNAALLRDRLVETYRRWKEEGAQYFNYTDNNWEYIMNTYEDIINNFKRSGSGKDRNLDKDKPFTAVCL